MAFTLKVRDVLYGQDSNKMANIYSLAPILLVRAPVSWSLLLVMGLCHSHCCWSTSTLTPQSVCAPVFSCCCWLFAKCYQLSRSPR